MINKCLRKKMFSVSLIIFTLLFSCTLMVGCSKPKVEEDDGNDFVKNGERVVVGELKELGIGSFEVGKDIVPGIYTATGTGTGNLVVISGLDKIRVNEVFGDRDIAVEQVRLILEEEQTVRMSGMDKVVLTPVASKVVKNKRIQILYSGTWIVGVDIMPGDYIVKNNRSEYSQVMVLSSEDGIVGNEIISETDVGIKEMSVTLKDGDYIIIKGSKGLEFKPQ